MTIHMDEIQIEPGKPSGWSVLDIDGDHVCFVPASLAKTEAEARQLLAWAAPIANRAHEDGIAVGERQAKMTLRRFLEL